MLEFDIDKIKIDTVSSSSDEVARAARCGGDHAGLLNPNDRFPPLTYAASTGVFYNNIWRYTT
jgi:hypothetical protein